MNNMKDRFVASNFDEVDLVLDVDRRFEEAIAAADQGEDDLVNAIIKNLKESGDINCALSSISEDDISEYNPEDDDALGILDCTAEDYREYVSDYDYSDGDGEIIDSVMSGDTEYDDYDEEDY